MSDDLEALRGEIDAVNSEITKVFVKRMQLAEKVAAYKRQHQLPILDVAREREVLNQMAKEAGADFAYEAKMLFNELFDLSRARQLKMLSTDTPLGMKIDYALTSTTPLFPKMATFVACQGIEGSYGQQAGDRLFFKPSILYFSKFSDVFQAVEKGMCSYGILPIENSIAGSVTQVYDLMREHHFYIARSVKLRVDHALLANRGAKLSEIREIFSHEQGLRQCSSFLANLKNVKITAIENTAIASRMVAESNRLDVASISSARCAEIYGLVPLDEKIQNTQNNYTRFICITRHLEIYPGANRVSLMLAVPHRVGALSQLIAKFAVMGLNLLKIESRPIPGRDFEFMFYFEIEAAMQEPSAKMLLSDLSTELPIFEFLGNYTEIE